MPDIILKVWGQITFEQYEKLKRNSSWLNVEAKLCLNCYFT